MRPDVLAQAASLKGLLAPDTGRRPGAAEFEAVIACAERLSRAGYPGLAFDLVESYSATLPEQNGYFQIRLEVQAVRALYLGFSDSMCLERSRSAAARFAGESGKFEPEYAQLLIHESAALIRVNRVDEAVERLERIAAVWRSRPDSIPLAMCCGFLSTAYIARGDWENARRLCIEQLVSARRLGADYMEGSALGNLCIAERGRCRFLASEDAAREAIQSYQRAGAVPQIAHVTRSLAITMLKRGKAEQAEAEITRSLSEYAIVLRGANLWYGKLLLGMTRIHLGHMDSAREPLGEPFIELGDIRESRPELLRLEYLGDVELEQGNAAEALKRYDEVLPHALALIPRGDVVAELRRRRAECYLLLGRPQEAYDEANEAIALCLELGDRYEEAATYRTIALAAAALGRHDEAKKHFDHAFAYYDDIETPYEWGKLWMAYGDWLCGAHAGAYASLDGAREAYRAACDHLEHMGAELKLAHAKARMAALAERLREEGGDESALPDKPRPRRRPSLDRELQRRVQWAFDTFAIVTRHRPLLDLLDQVARVAVSDIPVLVLGESGTGKELIARGVHALSGRTGRLVEVNCSAVPATLMEAEFFGSVHGSYTGSTRDRAGLFEEAHEGSIFMDEIGEMPQDLQSKLLRFLETGEVRRIGASTGRTVDARLIAATNRDAARLQAGDGFRQDLYYRLAHAVFTLPPLRSRGDDTELLVDHFLDLFGEESKKSITLSRAARERLLRHTWPGNVRELRALLQRLVVQSPDRHVVTPREMPLAESSGAPRNFIEEMEGQEKARILEALEKTQFIKADAARILRMSRTTLLGKMKRYRIPG